MYGWVILKFLTIMNRFSNPSHFRFLFGTCCQLPLSVNNSFLYTNSKKPTSSNLAAAYEKFGSQVSTKDQLSQSARPQIINNQYQYYGSSAEEDNDSQDNNKVYLNNNFQVPDQSVMVSSPSSMTVHINQVSSEEQSHYHLPPSHSQSYSPELPSGLKNQTSGEASVSQSTVRCQTFYFRTFINF